MPSIQKRIVSVAEQIAALQARALKLETFPPNGATVLAQGVGSAATMAFRSTFGNLNFNYTTIPVTIRPIPFLAIVTVGAFGGDGAGTAQYVNLRLAVTNNTGPVVIDALSGAPLTSGMASCNNVTGVTQSGSFMIAGVLPAGPAGGLWYFQLQYGMLGGGATTQCVVPGPTAGSANTTFLVLQLAG